MESFKAFFPPISEDQWQLLNAYSDVLTFWNEKINLVSRKDIAFVKEKHILPVLPAINLLCFNENDCVLDVGTGGGIPGIPLAILYPKLRFTLLDSIQKKVKAVKDMVDVLQLENVEVVCDRLENISAKFDIIVGRGVVNFETFVKWVSLNMRSAKSNVVYWTGGEITLSSSVKKFTQSFDLELFFKQRFCLSKKILCYSKNLRKICI